MPTVTLDAGGIVDRATFHAACARAFGFPEFYGSNMDAWIDCMSSLTDKHALSSIRLERNEALTVVVQRFEDFLRQAPDVAVSFVSCTAAVNCRYAERNEGARVVLVLE